MTYYVLNTVRERCLGDATDGSQDATLNRFGAQADSLINDKLFIVANRNRRLFSLPALPLPNPPQSLIEAANDLATSLYKKWQGQIEIAESYEKAAYTAVEGFVLRLDSDSSFVGVVLE